MATQITSVVVARVAKRGRYAVGDGAYRQIRSRGLTCRPPRAHLHDVLEISRSDLHHGRQMKRPRRRERREEKAVGPRIEAWRL